MSFANGCLSLAEWLTSVFSKLQHRGVLDFDRAMWQFVYILLQVRCKSRPLAAVGGQRSITTAFVFHSSPPSTQPRLVYKDSVFHKQTNATWARDDPAFIITLTAFMLLSAVAYAIAFPHCIFVTTCAGTASHSLNQSSNSVFFSLKLLSSTCTSHLQHVPPLHGY